MVLYLHSLFEKLNRARSSVGSEHLVYTQGVRGSNPFAPTSSTNPEALPRDFLFRDYKNLFFGGYEIKNTIAQQWDLYLQPWFRFWDIESLFG